MSRGAGAGAARSRSHRIPRVYVAPDPLQAQLIVGMLEQHGIRARIEGEALWGARGELPLGTESSPSVWVEDADAERAAALIHEFMPATNPERCPNCGYILAVRAEPRCPECGRPYRTTKAGAWRCPECGEQHDGQFTECWNCGRSRETPAESEDGESP